MSDWAASGLWLAAFGAVMWLARPLGYWIADRLDRVERDAHPEGEGPSPWPDGTKIEVSDDEEEDGASTGHMTLQIAYGDVEYMVPITRDAGERVLGGEDDPALGLGLSLAPSARPMAMDFGRDPRQVRLVFPTAVEVPRVEERILEVILNNDLLREDFARRLDLPRKNFENTVTAALHKLRVEGLVGESPESPSEPY